MEDRSTRLAEKLDGLSEAAIDKLREVIDRPAGDEVGEDEGRLLRAQVAASLGALNTQVRVDAMRMRVAREDKALEKLLAIIASKETVVPCDVRPALGLASDADVHASMESAPAATTAG